MVGWLSPEFTVRLPDRASPRAAGLPTRAEPGVPRIFPHRFGYARTAPEATLIDSDRRRVEAETMVDRVYKAGIPALRRSLEELKTEFSKIESSTDWTRLRIEPVLEHARLLEKMLKSQAPSRLSKGVRLFHSDLVYLRENVAGLKQVLNSERRAGRRNR